MSLPEQILALQSGALDHLSTIDTAQELEDWRVQYLGRRGVLATAISRLAEVAPEERRSTGQTANKAKSLLQDAFAEKIASLKTGAQNDSTLDVTLPGIPPVIGGLHLVRQTLYEIIRIFTGMGFTVFETNEVESDEYNFGLLNLPPDHPARDMWDTMYVSDDVVLRTHTSPGQIRAMRHFNPEPLRVILPGKCHRYEAVDASHESMFYQVEGLAVGEGITLASLKGVFEAFTQQMFGADRRVRFRGSYFPFTEPSVEIDITCNCLGAGCAVCKGTGWLEVSGGGMVHPTVLRNGGYDPDIVSGFAFGMGVERNAMLRHGIDDIRHFYANDLRFLKQFA
ncbi:MAG: phenylalanine--tRNA ligase subunit alpha [Chloroflexota bacterium]|nr:phenylalanine--tRNA ligase subunit alpha [Chloroflexota bacterium]